MALESICKSSKQQKTDLDDYTECAPNIPLCYFSYPWEEKQKQKKKKTKVVSLTVRISYLQGK